MKKLAIFDLDGTLLNTIGDLGAACNFALRTLGYSEHPVSAYHLMVGNGVRKLLQRATPEVDDATLDKLLEQFRNYYDLHCTDSTTPYDGIPELLGSLRDEGVALAVATNKYQSAAERIIGHYFPDLDFVAVMGQEEGRPIKPDPSVVFAILNRYPTPKSEVMFCGDSAVDIETARRACVESVGVTWGFRPVTELKRAYADHIVNSPSEILEIAARGFGQ